MAAYQLQFLLFCISLYQLFCINFQILFISVQLLHTSLQIKPKLHDVNLRIPFQLTPIILRINLEELHSRSWTTCGYPDQPAGNNLHQSIERSL